MATNPNQQQQQQRQQPEDVILLAPPGPSQTVSEWNADTSEWNTNNTAPMSLGVLSPTPAEAEADPSLRPYTIYTHRQKNFIVLMSSLGGLFSPLSSSSILPALPVLASSYKTSISVINLSITVFMILQALAPSVTGDLADMAGRRPAYLFSFLFILSANLGLALQSDLAAFYVLRCLQSAGSSGMYSLNSGVVSDIATVAERGKYMGTAQAGIMLGPALSPVIGGLLTEYLGWRAIFWFLFIIAAVYLAVFALMFPETARKIVGDGSLPPADWFNRSVLAHLARKRHQQDTTTTAAAAAAGRGRHLRWPNPFKVLSIMREKDCACIMFATGIVYASWYTVTTTLASSMRSLYGLNTVQAGLCYLPFGAGAALAVFVNGRLLDWQYARVSRRHNATPGGSSASHAHARFPPGFPIERARLDLAWPQLYIGCAALISYGWTLQQQHRADSELAAPLILTFLIGVFMTTTYNSLNILLVDLHPDSPSTASAANNLSRCLMGAGGSAVIEPMVLRLGAGWAFTLVGLTVVVLATPMLYVVRRWAPRWREQRRIRVEERKRLESSSN